MTTAVKVGNIVWVDTSRGKCVWKSQSRVDVVIKMLWVCHRRITWWLHVVVAVLPAPTSVLLLD